LGLLQTLFQMDLLHRRLLVIISLKTLGKIFLVSLLQQTLVQNLHSIEKLVKEISDKNNNNTSASLAPIEKEEKVQEVEISK
jgi:hypothetical protein